MFGDVVISVYFVLNFRPFVICVSDKKNSMDLSQDTVDLVSIARKSLVLTKASLVFNFENTCSREIETIDSMIILLFPSSMRISDQRIVNQNYIENEDLESTINEVCCVGRVEIQIEI